MKNFVTLRFENPSTSSRYFSGSKDFSLDGLDTQAKCLRVKMTCKQNATASQLNLIRGSEWEKV